ncbi:MAG: hypothetical protein HQK51_04480 [Oligoflexia bacterium]|nr:hypothetical protein [Oligoflexia bacterium]
MKLNQKIIFRENFKLFFNLLCNLFSLVCIMFVFYSCDKYADHSVLCNKECRESDKGIAENFIIKLNKYDNSGYDYKVVKDRANDPFGAGKRWLVIEKSLYETKYELQWVDGHTVYYPGKYETVDGYYDDGGSWHEGYTKEIYPPSYRYVEGYWDAVSYEALIDRAYVGFNINNYSYGMSWSNFLSSRDANGVFNNLNSVGNNLYQDTSSGFLFEETAPTSKDLEKIAALKETQKQYSIAEKLAADFGLSEDRSIQIAKYALNWKKLSDHRAMTDADANLFFKQVFGFSAAEGRKAIVRYFEGEKTGYEDLIEKAAKANKVSPENLNKLIEQFITK